jgi:hypothetical protein
MKCSICGTESKGDARFCSGCGATLILPKTDETMLDLRTALFRRPVIVPAVPPASPGAATTGPPPAMRGPAPTGAPSATDSTVPSRSNVGALVILLIALLIVAYFVYQVATKYGASWIAAVTGTSTPEMKSAEPARGAPDAAPVPPAPEPRAAPTTSPRVAPETRAVPPPIAVPPTAVAPPTESVVAPKSPPKSTAAPLRPAAPRPPPKAPESAAMAAATTMSAPEPAVAPKRETPRTDRWRDMRDAHARCAQENLVSRVVCEQRVLVLYCSGYWGKVPQCPDAQNPYPAK